MSLDRLLKRDTEIVRYTQFEHRGSLCFPVKMVPLPQHNQFHCPKHHHRVVSGLKMLERGPPGTSRANQLNLRLLDIQDA